MAAVGTEVHARPEPGAVRGPEPREVRTEPTWLGRHWPVLALGAAAIAVALFSRYLIYPAFSWNRDEATYLWQVDALRAGRIFTTDGGAPQFFWPWLTGLRDGAFFSQYTVGWPLVLLGFDAALGSPVLALPLGSVLTVLGTYAFTRELTRDRTLAIVSATLMLASPVLVIQGGVYLAYLFALGLGLLFAAALLAGLRLRSRWWLLAAGLLLGAVVLTRPFDAVLWAGPMYLYALIVYWRDRRCWWTGVWWSGLAFAPFVLFTLLYNHRVSGSFTTFPITAKLELDRFGFGPRQLMPIGEIFDYTIGRAVRSVLHNFRTLPPFFVGSWIGAALATFGLWLRRRDRSTLALLGLAAVFPAGYFFFWGNLLSSRAASLSAPVYYIPIYAPASVFLATVLMAAWRSRRAMGVALSVIVAVATVPYVVSKIEANHKISSAQEPWKESARHIRGRALVFVAASGPYLMHLNPYSKNGPYLDDRILYALDRGAANLDFMARYPRRAPYLQLTTDPLFDDPVAYHDAPVPSVSLIPQSVMNGNVVTFRVQVTNPSNDRAVVAYLRIGKRVERRTLATDAARGETFETEWTVAPAGSPEAADGAVPLTKRVDDIRIGAGTGATPDRALTTQQIQVFSYRLDRATGNLELLNPSRKFDARRTSDGLAVHERRRVRGFDVQVVTNR
jgi:4-amino-4-deoxy-L-arabinose transferase-like glycosyltransferase